MIERSRIRVRPPVNVYVVPFRHVAVRRITCQSTHLHLFQVRNGEPQPGFVTGRSTRSVFVRAALQHQAAAHQPNDTI